MADGRTAVIELASPDLERARRGVEEGWLPNLAGLLARGRLVFLEDRQDVIPDASWTTMITGTEPAEHGILAPQRLVAGSYTVAGVAAEATRTPPVWAYLSDAGIPSTICSPYGAPLVPGLLGTQVIGWGGGDAYSHRGGARADPPETIAALEAHTGRRASRYGVRIPRTARQFAAYERDLLAEIDKQRRALAYLMERTSWQFFCGGLQQMHEGEHLLAHRPAAIDAVYRATDDALGALLRTLDGTTVLVVSPYVACPLSHAAEAVEPVLERAGWLVRTASAARTDPRLRALAAARGAVHRVVPATLRPALGRLVPRRRWLDELHWADVDWGASRAFVLPVQDSSFLRLNVIGREPRGTIEPGAAYDRACAQLGDLILGLRDADRGDPVAAGVVRGEELFGRPPAAGEPDLVVDWVRREGVRAVRSPEIGVIDVPREDPRVASHSAPGFVLAAGPSLTGAGRAALPVRGAAPSARLVDVAATVLALAGVPQPPAMTGCPINDLLP